MVLDPVIKTGFKHDNHTCSHLHYRTAFTEISLNWSLGKIKSMPVCVGAKLMPYLHQSCETSALLGTSGSSSAFLPLFILQATANRSSTNKALLLAKPCRKASIYSNRNPRLQDSLFLSAYLAKNYRKPYVVGLNNFCQSIHSQDQMRHSHDSVC